MRVERARTEDAKSIVSILVANRGDPGLFQEAEEQVRRNLGDFLVTLDPDGKVVGCAGMHRDSEELAEIYGVAVRPEYQGRGIGGMLMQKCKERATENHVKNLWLATIKPDYFRRYSFEPVSRWTLPSSVLLRKLRQVFQQPVNRWVPVLCGRHTFMWCRLEDR